MTDTHPSTHGPQVSADGAEKQPFLAGVAPGLELPIFVFAVVLVSLLSLSLAIVLPVLAQVEVNGQSHDLQSLRLTRDRMAAELLRREREREQGVLSVTDPTYDALKEFRGDLPSFAALREQLRRLTESLVPEEDAIVMQEYLLEPGEKTLTITGDVRNVGPRSMTVLAQFAEELGRLPSVSAVKPPLYRRVEEADGSMHSPFTIVLTLQ